MAADPVRGRGGDRYDHRAVLLAVDHHGQLPAAGDIAPIGGLAADLLRPASTTTRASCCSARSPRRDQPAGAATGRFLPRVIDKLEGRDVADAAAEYAQHIPMAGHRRHARLPAGGRAAFREFVESVLEGINLPPEDRIERMEGLFNYLLEQVHTTSTTRATTSQLSHRRRDLRPEAVGGSTSPGAMACC